MGIGELNQSGEDSLPHVGVCEPDSVIDGSARVGAQTLEQAQHGGWTAYKEIEELVAVDAKHDRLLDRYLVDDPGALS